MIDLLLYISLTIISLFIINYIITFVEDRIKWNRGISPRTHKPWYLLGKASVSNDRIYADDDYNIISIKTIADKF